MYYEDNMVLSYKVHMGDDMNKLFKETIGGVLSTLENYILTLYANNEVVAFQNNSFKELKSLYEDVLYSELNVSGEDGSTLYMNERQFNDHVKMFNDIYAYLENRIQILKEKHAEFKEEFEYEDDSIDPEMQPMKYFEKMMMDGLKEELDILINLISNCEILRTQVFVTQE